MRTRILRNSPRGGLPGGLPVPAGVGGVGGAAGFTVRGAVPREVDLAHAVHEVRDVGGDAVLNGLLARGVEDRPALRHLVVVLAGSVPVVPRPLVQPLVGAAIEEV
eukprot:CAMPEP_0118923062 /NCGR_PEP_ID=MMETSP1169-20130426/1737_1 /TAXON_ID=36882 /ORGANISM="Pyramimonas obovata, Strain CCMP722" /LENGTH=105 /DNA_ID=CAMNT_0006864003 /DNA_START=354 /DNA_END=671 /DNA_ORIENTATION=-